MADLEARGIPTVGVATTEFIEGAAAQAKSLGIDPALVFIPHPVQDRTDDELKNSPTTTSNRSWQCCCKAAKARPRLPLPQGA